MPDQWREIHVPTAGGGLPCLVVSPPALTTAPVLLLNLAADRCTNLRQDPYDVPVRAFLAAGHRAASIDLPCHGERLLAGEPEGIAGFAAAMERGEDVLGRFVAEGIAALDALAEAGLLTPAGAMVAGTSRGGYCALRLAAADPRIRAVAAYAPVTDWRRLHEFAAIRDRSLVADLALVRFAPALAGLPLWIGIGNQDARVGTDACMEFVHAVLAVESAQDIPSRLALHVVPESGHALSSAWRRQGADYLRELTDLGPEPRPVR